MQVWFSCLCLWESALPSTNGCDGILILLFIHPFIHEVFLFSTGYIPGSAIDCGNAKMNKKIPLVYSEERQTRGWLTVRWELSNLVSESSGAGRREDASLPGKGNRTCEGPHLVRSQGLAADRALSVSWLGLSASLQSYNETYLPLQTDLMCHLYNHKYSTIS